MVMVVVLLYLFFGGGGGKRGGVKEAVVLARSVTGEDVGRCVTPDYGLNLFLLLLFWCFLLDSPG